MWFKNLLIYRFTKPVNYSAEFIEEKLAEKGFSPCSGQDQYKTGWVPPIGGGEEYVHTANGCIMVCQKRQDKILPAAVVNEFLADKVDDIQAREDRKPSRKERIELKDEIIFELLPRAFSKSNLLYAYIDPAAQLLIVNSSSAKRAEDLVTGLREVLGSMPVIPLKSKNQLQHSFTQWLAEGVLPAGFSLGGECELKDKADESSVIRCKNQALDAPEIKNHIAAGMFVSKLSLAWDGDIEFSLDEQLAIKRLRFGDLINDQINEVDADSAAEQFDVDFAIMTGIFSKFIAKLLEGLGGEDIAEQEAELQLSA